MELTVQIGFAQLIEAIKKLPSEQRKTIQAVLESEIPSQKSGPRQFGTLKGLVTYIADDFDAPLDDFKDYM